jgi:quercetin dioxygenase-like cupin family protein
VHFPGRGCGHVDILRPGKSKALPGTHTRRADGSPALRLSWTDDFTQSEEHMDIHRSGSRPSTTGPEDYFTGRVTIDPIIEAPAPARIRAATVTFEPGARTTWHTHPLGQTIIVTAGMGWAQREGGPVEEIRPGDVVWFPPGEKHWHGATATSGMTHIAIQEALDGGAVEWLEPVTDEQYGSPAST